MALTGFSKRARRQPPRPRINWAHPLARDLAFLAPLSPASGLVDLVSGQRPTITGALAPDRNQYGEFMNFASGKRLDFPATPPSIGPTTPVTIAWTDEARSPASNSVILHANFGTAGSDRPFMIYRSTATAYRFTAGPSAAGAAVQWNAVGSPVDRQRNVYVLTAEGGVANATNGLWSLYLNGVRLANEGNTHFVSSFSGGFRVGATLTGNDPWEGLIGDLTMWPRVLNADEAAEWSANVNVLYEPRRILVPVASAPSGPPTLLTASAVSIGSTYATPRVTFTR